MFFAENLAFSDPALEAHDVVFMSREERFSDALRRNCHLFRKAAELGLNTLEDEGRFVA